MTSGSSKSGKQREMGWVQELDLNGFLLMHHKHFHWILIMFSTFFKSFRRTTRIFYNQTKSSCDWRKLNHQKAVLGLQYNPLLADLSILCVSFCSTKAMPVQPKHLHHARCWHGIPTNRALLKASEKRSIWENEPVFVECCVSTATGMMGFNCSSSLRQGWLLAGHLLRGAVMLGPRQGIQHGDICATSSDWGDFGDPSIVFSNKQRCKERWNHTLCEVWGHLSIGQWIGNAHLPKPLLQKLEIPDYWTKWEETALRD